MFVYNIYSKEETIMATYVEKFGGYIADNPNIEFEMCDKDGKGIVYSYDEVNTASMTNNAETLEITGGQGNFPLAILDTTKTLEFTFESSEFTLDMFAMANDVKAEDTEDYAVRTSDRFDVSDSNTITLDGQAEDGSIFINGFQEADEAATGKYSVDSTGDNTIITFDASDVTEDQTIRVSYKRIIPQSSVVSVLTTSHTARGALTATWPVYASGTDCSESSIKAKVHVFIPSVRATALPGFDSSYKSAMTQAITFTALDPKRGDKKMFDVIWEPVNN